MPPAGKKKRPSPAAEAAVLALTIDQARSRLETLLQDSDELATKALGALAIDIALLTIMTTERDGLCRYWLLPAAGFTVSGLLLFMTIRPRRFWAGPEPQEFYDKMGAASAADAGREMLAGLIAALNHNEPLLGEKSQWFKWGFYLLLVSIAGAVTVVFVS